MPGAFYPPSGVNARPPRGAVNDAASVTPAADVVNPSWTRSGAVRLARGRGPERSGCRTAGRYRAFGDRTGAACYRCGRAMGAHHGATLLCGGVCLCELFFSSVWRADRRAPRGADPFAPAPAAASAPPPAAAPDPQLPPPPVLAPVPMPTPPPSFCSEIDRGRFLADVLAGRRRRQRQRRTGQRPPRRAEPRVRGDAECGRDPRGPRGFPGLSADRDPVLPLRHRRAGVAPGDHGDAGRRLRAAACSAAGRGGRRRVAAPAAPR